MKTFPIQLGYGAKGRPHPLQIPWPVAELAYSVYAARYGRSQTLERLAERGGFGVGEMDDLLPDWQKRCDLIIELRNIVILFLDQIDGDPMAAQFFDARLIERARKATV